MIAIILAIVASALNAAASVLQRRVDRDEPDEHGSTLQMLWHLAHRPLWFGGIAAMVAGFATEAVALTLGRLALVEPLMIVELPLTLLGASWTFGGRLCRREWVAILGLALGLGAFVFALAPHGGRPAAVPVWEWLVAVGINVAFVVVCMVLGWRRREPRAALWGVATGATFGLMSALVSAVGAIWSQGGLGLLAVSWQTYAAVVVGPASFFLLQNALQAGSLVASQPGFTLLNPVASVLWGVLVFDEEVRGGLWLVVVTVGAAVVAASVLLLLRAPDGRHRQQERASAPAG